MCIIVIIFIIIIVIVIVIFNVIVIFLSSLLLLSSNNSTKIPPTLANLKSRFSKRPIYVIWMEETKTENVSYYPIPNCFLQVDIKSRMQVYNMIMNIIFWVKWFSVRWHRLNDKNI